MNSDAALLLLPGMLNDGALWRHQQERLSGQYDVRIGDLTQDESIEGMAISVLAAAPARFALCGLSMGGYVALEIMRRAPERVSALILMDTSARPDTEEQGRRRRDFVRLARAGKFRGVTPRLLPSLVSRKSLDDSEISGTIFAMAERLGREVYIRQQQAIMARIDSRSYLPEIICPTLIVVGSEDSVTPVEVAREMASLIHTSRLEIVQDSGHLPPLEQPVMTTDLIEFFLKSPDIV